MSNENTKKMISMYREMRPTEMFLSNLFRAPRENYYNSQTIEIDIERSDESVAIVMTDLATGYNMFSEDQYTNKEFLAPVLKEASPLNAFDLIKRQSGQNPFQEPNFVANAMRQTMKKMRKLEDRARRHIELQASQVLQTGTLSLIDNDGVVRYALDYKPKSTHFPTSGTTWGQTGSDESGDLISLANVIRGDGRMDPTVLIFGQTAFEVGMGENGNLRGRFETRRLDLGTISPFRPRAGGGQYRGVMDLGNYKFDVWTYNGRYDHPQTGANTQFVDPGKVICFTPGARLNATFGSIPRFAPIDPRVRPFIPARRIRGDRMDLNVNGWISDDGEQLIVGVGTRPLLIPTAIDTYGCLTTGLS